MDSGEQLVAGEKTSGDNEFAEWVSLTSDNSQFDIRCSHVCCGYSTADFMVTVHGDAVVLVPAAFRFASQMVAHTVLPDRGNGHVEIAVRRPSVRCALSYRFAYVEGRLSKVIGVSDTFMFVHLDGSCDCDDSSTAASTGSGGSMDRTTSCGVIDDFITKPPTMVTSNRLIDTANMSVFISSLMDTRSSAPQCSTCKGPSNYRQVLEYLTKNINHLFDVDSNIERERIKYLLVILIILGINICVKRPSKWRNCG